MKLQIKTPDWSLPLLKPARYKGIKGGRGSGKSHFVAEACIEDLIINPNNRGVCIRENQKSLDYSSKRLLEDKVHALGVSHLFEITLTEIRRKGFDGVIIFKGMRDHTAESIKSLEGFDWAWVEEAQSLSHRSLELLRPTIRKENSELWFTWNPRKKTDAVDNFFCNELQAGAILVHVNYTDNPFCPNELKKEADDCAKRDPEKYRHVWLGAYDEKSDAKIFCDRWSIQDFDIDKTFGHPLHGLDFGFSQDPNAAVRVYIKENRLYITNEAGGVGIELDETAKKLKAGIPNLDKYIIYADNARPESISFLKRNGLPRIIKCDKWKGSVEDGISFIKSFTEVIIHKRCKEVINEFDEYSYKVDPYSGQVTDQIIDANNHYIDAVRYALCKVMQRGRGYDYTKLAK